MWQVPFTMTGRGFRAEINHPKTAGLADRRADSFRFFRLEMGRFLPQNRPQLCRPNPTYRWEIKIRKREEQIIGTKDKPQWIVAQRLLSHLQYLDATKSSTKDLSNSPFNLGLVGRNL